jgi:hypothetical protein
MDINPLLLDLEVIQQLEEFDKLAVCLLPGNTKLFVDSSSHISGVTRWYNGYNREDVIQYLEKLIDNIEKSSNLIINGQHNDLSETLKLAIHKSFTGLNHLKNTYVKDSVIYAKIQLLTNKLKTIEKNLENFNINTLNFVGHPDNNEYIGTESIGNAKTISTAKQPSLTTASQPITIPQPSPQPSTQSSPQSSNPNMNLEIKTSTKNTMQRS